VEAVDTESADMEAHLYFVVVCGQNGPLRVNMWEEIISVKYYIVLIYRVILKSLWNF
jgi:hypothetical protein